MTEAQAQAQPLEGPVNGGGVVGAPSENLRPSLASISKRQRRPSVRLGDIGDQRSYDSFIRRSKLWNDSFKYRHPSQKDTATTAKSSKTRPLVNLSNGGDHHETLEIEEKNPSGDGNLDLLAFGNRKAKDLRAKKGGATKRVRSNWVSKVDEGPEDNEKSSGEEGGNEGYRDFDPEGSESPIENPTADLHQNSDRGHGNEREEIFLGQRRPVRARLSVSRDHDAVELECGTSADRNEVTDRGRCLSLEDGIPMWLNGLGLGRYVPVFEIHEVDEEVLPLLTLDDLKDMGIHAVGSRRKMYCAIQKLRKGF